VAATAFNGAVLTARDGAPLDTSCEGLADRARGLQWSAHTPSQVASISKQFAAAVALLLADQGVVGLDDPVRRHLPIAPSQWEDVSLRQLMTHTAGVSHWSELAAFVPSAPMHAAERLAGLLDGPLVARPGSEWRYSSPGYIVLAGALAAASGRPYAELARELIVDRLGLQATTIGEPPGDAAAAGYRDGEPVAPWELHTMPGTGDVWSSASDLLRFVTALHTGALLPSSQQDVFRELHVPLPPKAAEPRSIHTVAYGCGHFLGTVHGDEARLHPGDNPGYLALAAWLPSTQTAVVALSNDEASDIEAIVADAVSASRR
jgi:CubicO group peptidase (beta-lactamase class C family)